MFSALDVDLRPGQGLGIFEIGSSLWSVLDLLRHNNTMFPRVDVKFDPDTPSTTPIILHIPPHLDLLFTGHHQRLSTIVLRRLRDPNPPLTLRYKDIVLSSNEGILKRVDVSRSFGPTYPGEGLQYPGVAFSFEEDGISESLKGTVSGGDDRMQEVKRVIVTQKSSEQDAADALDEVAECLNMHGSIRQAVVKVHDGVLLYIYPSSSEPVHVRIGITSAQDLNCELGPPLRIYYKEDNRMAIHSSGGSSQTTDDAYFYNYFQHGVDIMLSGTTHIVQKIILHSNIPGSPMFQRHQRCPWEIEGSPEDEEDDSPPRVRYFDKFDTISHFLATSREQVQSMLLDRAEDDKLTLPSSTTRLIGFDGIILEVTESGQVATVMLF